MWSIIKTHLSTVVGGVGKWWQGLSVHNRMIFIIVVSIAGIITYQHLLLKHEQATVEGLQAQVAQLVTKSQVSSIESSIKTIQDALAANQVHIDQINTDVAKYKRDLANTAPIKEMSADEIVQGFRSLATP